MDNGLILIISFSSCILLTLCCACIRFCKQREREIQEKINVKKLHNRFKRNKIIKPIIEPDENFNEELKDEKENIFRAIESV